MRRVQGIPGDIQYNMHVAIYQTFFADLVTKRDWREEGIRKSQDETKWHPKVV